MGIAIPRPQMRAKERRDTEARLRRHAEIMAQLMAEGATRNEASRRALTIMESEGE